MRGEETRCAVSNHLIAAKSAFRVKLFPIQPNKVLLLKSHKEPFIKDKAGCVLQRKKGVSY